MKWILYLKKIKFYLKNSWKIFRSRHLIKRFVCDEFPNLHIGVLHNHAIGPFALSAEQHLRHCEVHNLNPHKDLLLVASTRPCNVQLQRMVDRQMSVVKDDVILRNIEDGGHRYLENNEIYVHSHFKNGTIYNPRGNVKLKFTEDEEIFGYSLFNKLGIRKPFVLVSNKDDVYYKMLGENKWWDVYRSSSFEDLLPSIDYLKKEGYSVIRMGHYNDEPGCPYISLNACSSSERDFLDIFLQKECVYSICGDSGIAWIPYLFKTPILMHNVIPMGESPPIERGIFLPKLLRRGASYLTLAEILKIQSFICYPEQSNFRIDQISADRFQSIHLYKEHGIEIVDNSPDEVFIALRETELYVQNRLELTEEDDQYQERFKRCFPVGHPMRHQPGIVSPNFLRKHHFLLC